MKHTQECIELNETRYDPAERECICEDKFECCFCHKEIKRKDIPKEFFEKLETQALFHNNCANKENKS